MTKSMKNESFCSRFFHRWRFWVSGDDHHRLKILSEMQIFWFIIPSRMRVINSFATVKSVILSMFRLIDDFVDVLMLQMCKTLKHWWKHSTASKNCYIGKLQNHKIFLECYLTPHPVLNRPSQRVNVVRGFLRQHFVFLVWTLRNFNRKKVSNRR